MKVNPKHILYALALLTGAGFLVFPFIAGEVMNPGHLSDMDVFVLLKLRIPRLLLAVLVGSGLSVAGLIFQVLLQNNLASPYTLGIASGSSLGAVFSIVILKSTCLPLTIQTVLFSLTGGSVAVILVFIMGKRFRTLHTNILILGGIAVSYFFSSVISLVFYFADYSDTFRILRWMMGGLSTVGYADIIIILPFFALVLLFILYRLKALNIMNVSETWAAAKGVDVEILKREAYFAASALTALLVAFAGPIAFIGLIIPHISRLIAGPQLNRNIWIVIALGAFALMLTDSISQYAFYPNDFPVGILTGMIGGPFFLGLLLKKKQ